MIMIIEQGKNDCNKQGWKIRLNLMSRMDKKQYNQLFIAKLWSKWSMQGRILLSKQDGISEQAENLQAGWKKI